VSDEAVPIVIQIMDKDYTVACPPEEKEGLLESAKLLNERMREVRDSGKVMGTERMAVMAALNLIHEVYLEQQRGALADAQADATIRALETKLANAIPQRASVTRN
jgi:cell division protein ZapA